MFEPLGYTVEAVRHPLDERFPEWGESSYFSVAVHKTTTLADLLTHLYVLIPVFDNRKHYYVGDDEMEKLLAKGEGWLAQHPEKDEIARRYLKFQPSLYREALARLVQEEEQVEGEDDKQPGAKNEDALEKPLSLNELVRLGAALAAPLRASGTRVMDPWLRRRQTDPRTAERQAIHGSSRSGCLNPVSRNCPEAAEAGAAAGTGVGTGTSGTRFAHVP